MIKKIKEFFNLIHKKKYDTLAGSLTFFFLLTCIPILYITLFFFDRIASWMNLELELLNKIKEYISFDPSVGVSIIFILTTIYSTTKLFVQIKKIGDIVYMEKREKKAIAMKILSVIVAIIFILILILGLLILALADHLVENFPPIIVQLITILILGGIFYCIILVIDKLASPKIDIKENVHRGALVTMTYTVVASLLFGLYINIFSNFEFLYGYLTTLLVFLLWVYLIMKGIVIGVIINYAHDCKINNKKAL